MIKDNLAIIRENIAKAAVRSGRKPEDVKLVAVSKTVGPDEVREAFLAGQRDFAENRVQKLMEKFDGLTDIKDKINWHLIGQLQTNKIKYCADEVVLIHSVDRIGLAEALSEFGEKRDFVVHGLLEVNVSGEESKTGMEIDDVNEFIETVQYLPNISIDGLMTMAPLEAQEKELHAIFEKARMLAEGIQALKIPNMPMGELSMGMSRDYEIAVAEGATICRVGTSVWQ